MASSPKFICSVFLTLLALFFTHIHAARESQFFSKVSPTTASPSTINNDNVKDTALPTKEADQQPEFLPETQGYGLYGQESSKHSTSSYVPNYTPETTKYQESYTSYPNSNTKYYNNDQYNNDAYKEQREGNLGETSLHDAAGYTTTSNQNDNYYSGASGYSNSGKQGMSDTRFLEHGKYFFDVKNDNNYYPNDEYPSSRYNYNPGGYYRNNGKSYEYNNNGGRYQSQNDFPDEQYVP